MIQPLTIPNRNIMERAASMDNPAPDNDASVKSLGIFLLTQVNIKHITKSFLI